MKKILLFIAAMLLILWAVLFFYFKTGEVTFILLIPVTIIALLLLAIRQVKT